MTGAARQPKRIWRPVGRPQLGQRLGPLELKCASAFGGGVCWVAAKPLAAREVIEPGEEPTLAWDASDSSDLEAAAFNAATAFLKAGGRHRQAVLQMCRGPDDAKQHRFAARRGAERACVEFATHVHMAEEVTNATHAAEAARINAFHGLDGALLLFEKCCRFNHSCAPNAEYGLTDQNHMKVRALRNIAAGEEVYISYLGNAVLLSSSLRKRLLKERYFFECACPLCSVPTDTLEALACVACGGHAIPGQSCANCGRLCDDLTPQARREAIDVEMAAERLAHEMEEGQSWGASELEAATHRIEQLFGEAQRLRLLHHVVYVRLQMLSLDVKVRCANIAHDAGERIETMLDAAWQVLEELRRWFASSPLAHCCGMILAEPAACLLKMLRKQRGRRHARRAGQLQALLRGESAPGKAGAIARSR